MILESGIINIYLLPNTLQSATVQFGLVWFESVKLKPFKTNSFKKIETETEPNQTV